MKKKSIFILLPVITAGIIAVSCKKETSSTETPTSTNEPYKEGMIQLGKKINDPYSIENMRKAYANIAGNNLKSELAPNKLYLRFLPKNEDELALLKSDTTLILYDFPLDYEIDMQGTYYHDPSLPKDAITWQYVVVPVDYVIPNIKHEILYEVFIPAHEDEGMLKSSELDFYARLEEESFRLTGNLPEVSEGNRLKGLLPAQWTPKGRIMVWDDLLYMNIPLQGAKVHGRWSTHTETCLTNADGYYTLPQFRYEVNYAIKWERADWDIRDGNYWQAWYNGPKQKGDWNLTITGGKSLMFATMHRAADKFFYGDNLGIRRPTQTNSTKLCYNDEYGAGEFWGNWGILGILPDIKIWGKANNNSYNATNVIFGYTIHELGHQSHWQLIGINQFANTSKIIYESWATAVEWALTNDEYHKLGSKYNKDKAKIYNHEEGTQGWMRSWPLWEYSPIFIDLIDDNNQRYKDNSTVISNTIYPNDKIKGYTLSSIQNNILKKSYALASLKDAIKAYKTGGVTTDNKAITDADVDELLRLY